MQILYIETFSNEILLNYIYFSFQSIKMYSLGQQSTTYNKVHKINVRYTPYFKEVYLNKVYTR